MLQFSLLLTFAFMSQAVFATDTKCTAQFSDLKLTYEQQPHRRIYEGISNPAPGTQHSINPILDLVQSALSGRTAGQFELYAPNGKRWFLEVHGVERLVLTQYALSAKKAGTRIKTEQRLNEPVAYFEFSTDAAQVAHPGNHAQHFTRVVGAVGTIMLEGYEQVGDLSQGAPQLIMRSTQLLSDTTIDPETGKRVTLARLLGIRLTSENANRRVLALGERIVVRGDDGLASPTLKAKFSLFVAKPIKE